MIKLPPDTLEILTVGKTIDGRLPCAIVDTAALTVEERNEHQKENELNVGEHKQGISQNMTHLR